MGTIQTLLQIKADATQAVRGLKPLQASLEETTKDAKTTEKALNELDGTHKITVNDQAVENARKEIDRLRAQMRKDLSVDVNANTTAAQKRIKQLQSSVRSLDAQRVVVDVDVDTRDATSSLASIGSSIKGFAAGFGGAVVGKELFDAALGASTFETNMRAVNTVLGDTVGLDIEQWIEDQADALNLSEVAASDAARSLSLYGSAAEAAGVPAERFIEQMIEVAAQSAAFSGKNPADAVMAIGAAFRGEFDSLEQFGVNLTQAQIDAEGMATGLLKANGEWVTGGKQVAAYNLILKQSAPLMGSVGRNSDTLGGKLADLQQHSKDLGTTLGRDLTPVLEDLASVLGGVVGPLDSVLKHRQKIVDEANRENEGGFQEFSDNITTMMTGSLGDILDQGKHFASDWKDLFTHGDINFSEEQKAAADKAAAAAKKVADAEKEAAKEAAEWDATVREATSFAVSAWRKQKQDIRDVADAVDRLDGKYQDLIGTFSVVNQSVVDSRSAVYDYQGAIDDLAESLVDSDSFNPDLEEGRTNWNNLVAMAETASANVQRTLTDKGGKAADAIFRQSRRTMHQMLVDAGIDSQAAWTLVNQAFQKPVEVKIELKKVRKADLKADIKRLQGERQKLTIGMGVDMTPQEERRFRTEVLPKINKIDAKIEVKQRNLDTVKGKIAEVTDPDDAYKAGVKVEAHTGEAETDIQNFIKLRRSHIKIFVDVEGIPSGPAGTAGSPTGPTLGPTVPRLLSGTQVPLSPTTTTPPVNRIAPKQTPIAVYLDGVEIAHRIEGRRALATVESVRRNA